MKRGDPLKYWNWYNGSYLSLKAGYMLMARSVYYSPKRRVFTSNPAEYTHHHIPPERIDQRAVAEALAVSLTYEEGT